jgi:hypothetical protein
MIFIRANTEKKFPNGRGRNDCLPKRGQREGEAPRRADYFHV